MSIDFLFRLTYLFIIEPLFCITKFSPKVSYLAKYGLQIKFTGKVEIHIIVISIHSRIVVSIQERSIIKSGFDGACTVYSLISLAFISPLNSLTVSTL